MIKKDRYKMFKSKEQLLKKEDEFFDDLCSGYNTGILVAFKSFSERIEFYKTYRDNRFGLEKEHPEINKIATDYLWVIEKKEGWCYNEWLFAYCFGDVE
jgi:hypothetical protein